MASRTIHWMIVLLQNMGIPSIQKLKAGLTALEVFATKLPGYETTAQVADAVDAFYPDTVPIEGIEPDKLWVQNGDPDSMIRYLQIINITVNGLVKLRQDLPPYFVSQIAQGVRELSEWYKALKKDDGDIGKEIDSFFPKEPQEGDQDSET